MIQAFFFDLDGTICDTLEDIASSVNHSLKMHGFQERPVTGFIHFLGNGSKVMIHKAIGDDSVSPIEEKAVFDDYLSYYETHFCEKTHAFAGMENALSELKKKGISLFCVTNKPDKAAKEIVGKCYPGLFTETLGISKDLPTKPDPTGILSLIQKYGLKKDECAMGGDSDVDLILARNASIPHTVAVAWGYRPLGELFAEHPEAVIYRPRELLSLPFVTE